MSYEYLMQVNEDLDQLGLEKGLEHGPPHQWNYRDLAIIINRTYVRTDYIDSLRKSHAPVITHAAKQVITIIGCERPVDLQYHVCCSSAEQNLVADLAAPIIANPSYHSPLILERDGQALAIIKGFGETSCYALVDEPSYGLVEGTFGTPLNRAAIGKPPKMDGAWQLPIEEAGKIVPLRLSIFSIPVRERLWLGANTVQEPELNALAVSHEDIVQAAQGLLSTAHQLWLPDLSGEACVS